MRSIVTSISSTNQAEDVAVSQDGTRAYVTGNSAPSSVAVIDTTRNLLLSTLPVPDFAYGVAYASPGVSTGTISGRVWVDANQNGRID